MTITTKAEMDFIDDLKGVFQKHGVYFSDRNGLPRFYNLKENIDEEIYLQVEDVVMVLKSYVKDKIK